MQLSILYRLNIVIMIKIIFKINKMFFYLIDQKISILIKFSSRNISLTPLIYFPRTLYAVINGPKYA